MGRRMMKMMQMMNQNNRNYQKVLDETIRAHERAGERPRLLLHACCAPCSSYVLEYLSRYFRITVFDYTPIFLPKPNFGCERRKSNVWSGRWSSRVSAPGC